MSGINEGIEKEQRTGRTANMEKNKKDEGWKSLANKQRTGDE